MSRETRIDSTVRDYLRRLEDTAARSLTGRRRTELVAEVREHIDVARADLGPGDEAGIREVLDRLGDPEDIVAAEAGPAPPARGTGREVAAVVLLLFGGFVFLVGWLAGVLLLWTSDRWRLSDRLLGTFVLPGGLLAPLLLGLVPGEGCVSVDGGPETCTGFSFPLWLGLPIAVLLVVAPVAVGVHLLNRARRAAAAGR
jgi:hypothetical protein